MLRAGALLGAAFFAAGRAAGGAGTFGTVAPPAGAGFLTVVGTGFAPLDGDVAGTFTPVAPDDVGGGVDTLVVEAEETAFAVSVK